MKNAAQRAALPAINSAAKPALGGGRWLLASLFALSLCQSALAFPPAPNHTIYGLVRDELGDPIRVTNAVVTLETATGIQIKTTVVPNLGPGMNYRLSVPMDAGLTSDAYKPTALRPLVSFRMKVVIGSTTYLPIELHGSYLNLGKPAQKTHLDLTMGVDSVGDGLPDAWKQELIDMLGLNCGLQDIKPGDDADGDGMSNWAEYIAGTYAFDSTDNLRLYVAGMHEGNPLMDFLAIRGRTYTILSSTNLTSWSAVNFRLPLESPNGGSMGYYYASSVHRVRAEVTTPDSTPANLRVFKLLVQ